jgi:coproporphyrinogen III oxidase
VTLTLARSAEAAAAYALVVAVQRHMVTAMEAIGGAFTATAWLRDDGRHGGGERWGTGATPIFDRASVNVSQVHYDDEPTRKLASATALSTIIHPANPRAPSIHLHLSWTELRGGGHYWRMMADLNPAIEDAAATARFVATLREATGDHFDAGAAQGGRYFWIPALGRHRGVAHFYLEGHRTTFADDVALARGLGDGAIATYAALVAEALAAHPAPTDDDRARQLAYHTLYLFQVLTLDRGTTSGLLIHDQNDVGILGSLPSHVDRALLASWAAKVPAPQDGLVRALVEAIAPGPGGDARAPIDDPTKRALAAAVRAFYRAHPEAIELQASGDVIPPTVANHR